MSIPKPSSLVKPTVDTKFHIDYDWWEQQEEDLRIYLLSHVQDEEQRTRLGQNEAGHTVDYIHPETGEVFKLDELQLAIQKAAEQEDFVNPQASVVDNIFRVFLKNGNKPLSPKELADVVEKSSSVILKTIGGKRIYKGIRPIGPA